jgi:hypothetical protein
MNPYWIGSASIGSGPLNFIQADMHMLWNKPAAAIWGDDMLFYRPRLRLAARRKNPSVET